MKTQKKIDVFDIRRLLLENVFYSSTEMIGPYGIAFHLKKYSGIDERILLNKCSFEHGVYFNKIVCQNEVTHHVKNILTYSPFREGVIKELTDITPIAIGPYIAYAENYYSKEYIKKIKNKLGCTLLIMPSHSTENEDVNYNVKEFIQYIENIKKGFDSVMICIRIEDLKKGLWKPYKEKGYHIVSVGPLQSPYFFSRTKYIFHLADAFVTNTITTGMAFAMYLERPIKIVKQNVKYNIINHSNINELEVDGQISKVYEIFSNDSFVITKEQREFGKYVFGLDSIKSKEEIRTLLLSLTRMSK